MKTVLPLAKRFSRASCLSSNTGPWGVQYIPYNMHTAILFSFVMAMIWWTNSLWPSGAIWRHRFMSALAQVMVCCLSAPSPYLNQCWLLICEFLWRSSDSNLTVSAQTSYSIILLKLLPYFPGANELIDGLVQDCSNSIANALELLQSCTKLS